MTEVVPQDPFYLKAGSKKQPYQKKNTVYFQELERPRDQEQWLKLTIKQSSYFVKLLK